jgi:hypothetical protein
LLSERDGVVTWGFALSGLAARRTLRVRGDRRVTGMRRDGTALGNPVLRTEGRVTMIDAILACAVLLGLILNAAAGWWWADPAAGYMLVYYAAREVRDIFSSH